MRRCKFILNLTISLLFFKGQAQLPDTLPFKQRSALKFKYDNDVFCGTDQYYSQGILIEYRSSVFKKSPFSKVLMMLKSGSQNEYALAIQQDVYTPKSILNLQTDPEDRPYAGVFMISQLLSSMRYESRMKMTTKVDLGLIGSLALGEEEQKFIHKQIADRQPIGWENQVSNSFIVNYNVLLEKGIVTQKYFELTGTAGGVLGILQTHAEAGALMRLGKMRSYFKFKEKKRDFELYATLQGSVRYVAYNAVMEGVGWVKCPHTLSYNQLEPVIYRSNFGFTLAFKKFNVSYSKFNITREIKKGLPHAWGSLQLMVWI